MVRQVNFGYSTGISDPYNEAQRAQDYADALTRRASTIQDYGTASAGQANVMGLTQLAQALLARYSQNYAQQKTNQADSQMRGANQGLVDALVPNVAKGGQVALPTTLDSLGAGDPSVTMATHAAIPDAIDPNHKVLSDAISGADPRAANGMLSNLMLQRALPPDPAIAQARQDKIDQFNALEKDRQLAREQAAAAAQTAHEDRVYGIDQNNQRAKEIAALAKSNKAEKPTAAQLSPEAVHDAMIDVFTDPARMRQYASFGQQGQDARTAINNEKAKTLRAIGMTEDQVIRQQAIAKAQVKSVAQLVPMQNALNAYETVARGNGERVLELVNKVNKSGVPLINSAERLGKLATGDPDAAELMQVLQNYQTETARIIANPNLTGQLTDTARSEIQGIVPANMTAAQAARIVNRLNFEFDLRNRGVQDSLDKATSQASVYPGAQPSAPSPAPPPASAPPMTATGPNGERVQLVNGAWVPLK